MGIALFEAFHLILQKYDLGREIENLAYTSEELARRLEYWFADYSKLWRSRNKESELYRIRDAVAVICGYLRKL
jgi:hypothetical protein